MRKGMKAFLGLALALTIVGACLALVCGCSSRTTAHPQDLSYVPPLGPREPCVRREIRLATVECYPGAMRITWKAGATPERKCIKRIKRMLAARQDGPYQPKEWRVYQQFWDDGKVTLKVEPVWRDTCWEEKVPDEVEED